jgi:Zn-dependent protease/CBS domain-containing protein
MPPAVATRRIDGHWGTMKPAATQDAHHTRQVGVDLFRVFGVQVAVDYSWLVIFSLVLWSLAAGYFPRELPGYGWLSYAAAGLVATLLFFGSVLVHELSHALVANRLGERVERITLFIFGGMAHLSGEPRDAASDFKIAAVGPFTSLLLAGMFRGISSGLREVAVEPLWTAVFHYLGFVNLALAVFNLLPGLPLDGGRLVRALFWRRTGDLGAATRRAASWGGGIAIGLMLLGGLQIFAGALVGGLWLIFIGMFLRGAARSSFYGVVVDHALAHARVRDLVIRDPIVVDPDTTVDEAVEAYFLRYGYGGFPVGRPDALQGVVSLPHVQRCPREERSSRTVREIMRPIDDQVTIDSEATVSEALHKMVTSDSGRLLVRENGQLRGLITRSGILRFVQMKTQLEAGEKGEAGLS